MIDQIFSTIAGAVNRHPKLVIAVIGIVFVVALIGTTMITMETGTDTYLDRNSALGITNKHYTDSFAADKLVLIVETSDPLSPDVLAYLDRLESDINKQQNVESASSIVDVLKSMNGGVLPQSKGRDRRTGRTDP